MATFTHNKGEPTLNRAAMPRFSDNEVWYPHGFGPESADKALADILRNAWGTPGWTLDIAEETLLRAGAPLHTFDPACRPGSESYKRILRRGGQVACGVQLGQTPTDDPGGRNRDGLARKWSEVTPPPPVKLPPEDGRAVSYYKRPTSKGSIWLNHPWSTPDAWIAQAAAACAAGHWVQVLAPHTTGKWWTLLWEAAAFVTCLSKVCFDLCPGLEGCLTESPPQQVSLVTLAPLPAAAEYPHVRPLAPPPGPPVVSPVDGRLIWTLTGPRWHEYTRLSQGRGTGR